MFNQICESKFENCRNFEICENYLILFNFIQSCPYSGYAEVLLGQAQEVAAELDVTNLARRERQAGVDDLAERRANFASI